MSGELFDTGGARGFHESQSQQQEALAILRHRPLTKVSFESDSANGCRLAPAIDILRNGWGFVIGGYGTKKDPYYLLDRNQYPQTVRTTEEIKAAYYETDHWASVRTKRYEHDDYRCRICTGACRDELQCHHLRYQLFSESLDDLLTVCRTHHEMIHEHSKLKFPTGVDVTVAELLLGIVQYEFEDWLKP